jgi:hypothetical protein
MGVQDAVPAGWAPPLTPCPRCGRDDRVQAVPAVYGAARSSEATIAHAHHVISDDDAMLSRKQHARATLAATPPSTVGSSVLAPAPKTATGSAVFLTVLLGIIAGGTWALYSTSRDTSAPSPSTGPGFGSGASGLVEDHARSGHNHTLLVVAVAITVVAAVALIGTVRSGIRRAAIDKGRAAAEDVWRRGWYCERCATVYFLADEAPHGIEPATAITPADFQRAVWTIGGYDRKGTATSTRPTP